MSTPTRLICLRHGESANVRAGVAGEQPAAPLTDDGRAQAAEAAERLRRTGSVTAVYSSTAVRAHDTARIIADALGVPARTTPALREVGIGTAEGATDATTRRRTADVLRAWIVDRDLSARVADGETGHQVVRRMRAALTAIAADHPGATVAVVGHVASLTVGLADLCALGDEVWGTPLPHARPFPVVHDAGTWTCRSWPTAEPATSDG